MLYIHPLIQVAATFLGISAFVLGLPRFLFNHMGRRAAFKWKRHVFIGRLAMAGWGLGLLGGLLVARSVWGVTLMTGLHWQIAFWMLPLLVFGLATGEIMHRLKQPRKLMPLLHGINNLLLLVLALWQFVTGWVVLQDFVFI